MPSSSLHDLVTFIDTSDLSESIKDTACRKLADPNLTWENDRPGIHTGRSNLNRVAELREVRYRSSGSRIRQPTTA
ncbi:hypothetical protein B2J88_50810 [Rhodococcus sp. SRB_17]|nr:hypothetical protein [Rhodococcus sp. SRB_17]